MNSVDTKISPNNSTVVPEKVRAELDVGPGDRILWTQKDNCFEIRKIRMTVEMNKKNEVKK